MTATKPKNLEHKSNASATPDRENRLSLPWRGQEEQVESYDWETELRNMWDCQP